MSILACFESRRLLPIIMVLFSLMLGCSKEKSDSVRLSNQGIKALREGNHELAHARFEDAVDIYPENANAHYGMGLVLIEFEKLEQAERHLRVATRLKPDHVEAHYQLALVLLKQDRLEQAEAAFTRVLDKDPRHASAAHNLGLLFEKRGVLKEAEMALRQAITLDPESSLSYLALARLYQRVAAEPEAFSVLTEGIRLNANFLPKPDQGMALLYNEKGILHRGRGEYSESIECFLKGINWDDNWLELVFNLGCAYASQGEPKMAMRYFNQYIRKQSNDEETVALARMMTRRLVGLIDDNPRSND